MNEAFEKILDGIESLKSNKGFGGTIQTMYADGMLDKAKQIVQEVVEGYNGGWIPCSERLPEYDEEYYNKNGTHRSYIVMNEKAYAPSVAYYTKDKLWFYDDLIEFKNVVAWQPLPEPYKESENND